MAPSYEDVLDSVLGSQRTHELSILKLSEPISGPLRQNAGERTSDVSADVFDNPSPASLEADLAHYKVCFSKKVLTAFTYQISIGIVLKTSLLIR
jgi:hypothetical protein